MVCDRTKVTTFLESAHNTSCKSGFKIKTAKSMQTSEPNVTREGRCHIAPCNAIYIVCRNLFSELDITNFIIRAKLVMLLVIEDYCRLVCDAVLLTRY